MRLSRGWYGLILFWTAVVSVCTIGAGTLQMLGSPGPEERSARNNDVGSTTVEFALGVPLVPFAVAAAADVARPELAAELVDSVPQTRFVVASVTDVAAGTPDHSDEASTPTAQEASPEPVVMAASETTAAVDQDASMAASHTEAFERSMAVAGEISKAANEAARTAALVPEKKLHLRIARDSKLCPQTTCYKWRLISQHSKAPRAATIDLAQLRLAPGLREAAENGDVQLIVDVVEHHKTIKGRDTVIFEATTLAGVLPP
jgi:hypothetical protein